MIIDVICVRMHVSMLCWRLLLLLLCMQVACFPTCCGTFWKTMQRIERPLLNTRSKHRQTLSTYIHQPSMEQIYCYLKTFKFTIFDKTVFNLWTCYVWRAWKSALTSTLKLHRMWWQRECMHWMKTYAEKIGIGICRRTQPQHNRNCVILYDYIGSMLFLFMLSSLSDRIISVVYAALYRIGVDVWYRSGKGDKLFVSIAGW